MIRIPALLSSVLYLLLAASSLRGQVIVDHPPHPYGGYASDTSFTDSLGRPVWQRIADNIMLTNPYKAISLVFWGFYEADNPPAREAFRVRIYGSRTGDGLPDDNSILSETMLQNPARTATGRVIITGIGPREFRYESALSSPISLEANTSYWLEVAQIGDLSTLFRWESSVAALDGLAAVNSIHADWQATPPSAPADAAFQLISPEPAASGLLGLVLVSVIWGRRFPPEGRLMKHKPLKAVN